MANHQSRPLRSKSNEASTDLGDFTTDKRTLIIAAIAIGVGGLSAFVALFLLRLISLFTNLFFYQRLSFEGATPIGNHLGPLVIVVPVVGAMIIGLIARYGSERIRGHGIPEAIEAILINGSKIQPRVAILKPLSSAISIGSGGPFGAEGPIIMTGGAFGSIVAQFLHVTNTERKTLLVAGAAAGMAATFATPVAAVMLAVELLLFEWKPRSLIPVALASATAAVARRYLLGLGPLFPTPPHHAFIGPEGMLACVVVGLLAGCLSAVMTYGVYASEDAFHRLPIHWMWWPPIGGLVIGLGGFIFPQALGVGYDTIGALLQGTVPSEMLLGILLIKSVIWAISLGSGTSGGVLAPLLMIGGALGGLESLVLPDAGPGFWPLVSMGAILGGTMRSPLTGIVFALELTHDVNVLLPLLIASFVAYAFTVLFMRRSILTEKVARRGFHLSREYTVDPLETILAGDAMCKDFVTVSVNASADEISANLAAGRYRGTQGLFPVLDDRGQMVGVITRSSLAGRSIDPTASPSLLVDVVQRDPIVAFPDEPLRVIAYRMAEVGLTKLPVIERSPPRRVLGIISLSDLLKARGRILHEEKRRERVFRIRSPFLARNATAGADD